MSIQAIQSTKQTLGFANKAIKRAVNNKALIAGLKVKANMFNEITAKNTLNTIKAQAKASTTRIMGEHASPEWCW